MKIGESIYFASQVRWKTSGYRKILGIGRKWILLEGKIKADKFTGIVDGRKYQSPGKIYDSEQEYLAEEKRNTEWSLLHNLLRDMYRPPENLTVEKIIELRKIFEDSK